MIGAHRSDDKRRPTALNLTPARSATAVSTDSDSSSLKAPRTPRFAEATSVHSPVDHAGAHGRSPFDDPEKQHEVQAVGFGYIGHGGDDDEAGAGAAPKSPLKSAMKVPGTPGRHLAANPLSPTFREEEMLEKREASTDAEQARDLKIKTRVRLAKFALRGVNFSCSLIILAMISSSFAIFNSTKQLPTQSKMPSWAQNTKTWPQKLVLAMSCVSLGACVLVFLAYCRGGHRRAERIGTYYTMFAIGWFLVSLVLWVVTAALFQNSKNNSGNKDMWGWSCVDNQRAHVFHDKVDYALVCRLQNWSLICMIIEIVVEVICITLYSVVFYRYYTKRRLTKSMDMRDRARSDLYLAQLRSMSAPNTPGFVSGGPKSPAAFSTYAMSPRHPPAAYQNMGAGPVPEASPFTPGGQNVVVPDSQFGSPSPGFKLQRPPAKAPSATPKLGGGAFTPTSATPPPAPDFAQPLPQQLAPQAANEPVYDAVPIPGAYADQAVKSPPADQAHFRHA
ncbi:hypothetical protein ISF_00896 [Cordyceps fumosorosea ARSEF 2679]|uniref:Hyphal anastamosis-8 protein n=1 Tax=Cordyceps fumosorosea (strain ARSEF 2679) TaxID=1081104 RepID=A0A168EMN4_CORFA|nr:hypothetical protein ISF_00896 [Cordyceps fumosorosea ARSEF 2679]OAA73995.1 hypothetical protein ISF_00896 [Cordyceps fumosorosea ARSEF 2679]